MSLRIARLGGLGFAVLVWLAGTPSFVRAADSASPAERPRAEAPGADLFRPAPLRTVSLDLAGPAIEALQKENRQYVRATFRDGETVLTNVGVHLKGAAGSFRGLEDRPALTVSFAKFVPGQRWHGLQKVHLNNSVQDESLLMENICGELFRRAGVPAPRATNVRVRLNRRDLGVYVLIEGFDKVFLRQYFKNRDGNLYDGGFCEDITSTLAKLSGDAAKGQPELKALAEAAEEPDAGRRWARLGELLDLDRFITFCALEVMMWDWDGYVMKPNNYKLYWDSQTRRIDFFPHGMDQMFWEPEGPIMPGFNGLVARGMVTTPEGRRRYLARMGELLTTVFDVATITNRINAYARPVRAALAEHDLPAAKSYDEQVERLRSLVVARAESVARQLQRAPQRELEFGSGPVSVSGWTGQNEDGAALGEGPGPEQRPSLSIAAEQPTTASWRAHVLLPAGRFRFEAKAKATGVVPIRDDKGEGAGIRVSGSEAPRANHLNGDTPWRSLAYEFDVDAAPGEVVLVCELRASKGRVWFEAASLRLVKVK